MPDDRLQRTRSAYDWLTPQPTVADLTRKYLDPVIDQLVLAHHDALVVDALDHEGIREQIRQEFAS